MKKKYIEISNCLQCPHRIFYPRIWNNKHMCGLEEIKIIENEKTIPKWCKLNNVK